MDAVLDLPIIDSPIMWGAFVLAGALAFVLLFRRPTWAWALRALIGVLVGGALGIGAFVLVNALDVFGDPLPRTVGVWVVVTLAAIGLAVVSLWRSRLWRRIVAALAVIVFAAAGALGINAYYGLDPTLGSVFGVVSQTHITLPHTSDGNAGAPGRPLSQTFTPPAAMPAKGERGSIEIPGITSGFSARPAGIYLPPAALVPDPPALPLVIMMMGQPGNPDPTIIGDVLDSFASAHDGLAPIVIVADQLGSPESDPACADSTTFGNAQKYITVDVPAWAEQNLNVIHDARYWVIAGYSNGGGCAIKYGASDPTLFKNIIDVSGEEFPGSEDPSGTTSRVFGGDTAAFEASKPISIMRAAPADTYDGMTAVFTAGGDDDEYTAAAQKVSAEAKAVGMSVDLYSIPGASHGGAAVSGGLHEGFRVLYPVLGLAASE